MLQRAPISLEQAPPESAKAVMQALNDSALLGDVLRQKLGRPKKGEEKGSNRTIKRGTNRNYTVARLHRDRPDLAERVEAGELSANAAAISARDRKISAPGIGTAAIEVRGADNPLPPKI